MDGDLVCFLAGDDDDCCLLDRVGDCLVAVATAGCLKKEEISFFLPAEEADFLTGDFLAEDGDLVGVLPMVYNTMNMLCVSMMMIVVGQSARRRDFNADDEADLYHDLPVMVHLQTRMKYDMI